VRNEGQTPHTLKPEGSGLKKQLPMQNLKFY
jgi:hypothetical protein